MEKYILSFKNYLINDKKSAINTVESYIRDINSYYIYSAENGIPNLLKADSEHLYKYINHLKVLGKSNSTVTRTTASIKAFYKFLVSKKIIKSNPADTFKSAKIQDREFSVLDKREVLSLLSQPNGSTLKEIRDKAILELLYATGIKVSELIALKIYDINLQLGFLNIKTEKSERIVPIYPAALKALSNYIYNVRPVIVEEFNIDNLFTNMSGQPITRQGLWKLIKYYANLAQIKKDITPHTLRHSFATHLLENGAPLEDIKEMLGHSDISTTQIYAKNLKTKYTRNYAKFHPLAK